MRYVRRDRRRRLVVSFFAGQARDWYAPMPLLTALPNMELWQLGEPTGLPGMMLCLGTFAILNHDILKNAAPRPIPMRFVSMLAIGTVCSAVWFAAGWDYAVEYHGWHYTFMVTVINAVWLAVLWVLWFWPRRSAGNWWRLAFSTLFQYWLFGMAFPWLGEYP